MKNQKETASLLAKAMYKMMAKALKDSQKDIVDDVLDDNFVAEVDPDKVPQSSSKVLWKKDKNKSGVNKLKSFIKSKKK